MKTAALLGLVVALLAVTTVASPPVASLLADLGFTFRFSRVYNRVFEILLVVALGIGLSVRSRSGSVVPAKAASGTATSATNGAIVGMRAAIHARIEARRRKASASI